MPHSLTQSAIDAASPSPTGDTLLFDSEVPGYGLKVTPAGRRILLLQYWSPVERGRRRRVTIGQVGGPVQMPDGSSATLSAHTGRKAARALRGLVDAGRDPFLERRRQARDEEDSLRRARDRAAASQSVEAVVGSFLVDARGRSLSPKTQREWKRLLFKHVVPVIGERSIESVGRVEADAVRTALPRGRQVLANRVQQVCCSLLNFAEDLRPGIPNPFVAGKRGTNRWFREELTRRPITREELGQIFAALDAMEDPDRGGSADIIRLLALTGWRKGEVLGLRWDQIDFKSGEATLGRTKTGRSERALSPEALALLQLIPQRGPFVFPSPRDSRRPRAEFVRVWRRVRLAAGVSKPLHSLRHAAATIALSEGVPLATVGALLGHRDPATTLRYARTEQKAALAAAAVLGAAIAQATRPANVTPISRPRRRR